MYSLLRETASIDLVNRGIRHLIVGGTGTLIYMGLVTIGVEMISLNPVVGVVVAFSIIILYTYTLNRLWVYRATKGHIYTVPRFLVVTTIGLTLNTSIMFIVVEILHLYYFWGLVLTAIVVPPTNFLLNYFWAFK